MLAVLTGCNDNDIVDQQNADTLNNQVSNDGELFIYTADDAATIQDYLKNKDVIINRDVPWFKDLETMVHFNTLLSKMQTDEYLKFCRSHDYMTLGRLYYETLHSETASQLDLLSSYPSLFYEIQEAVYPRSGLFRVINPEGIYQIKDVVSVFFEGTLYFANEKLENVSVKSIQEEAFSSVVIDSEDRLNLRSCGYGWERIRLYDGGDKRLQSIVQTWWWAGPVRTRDGRVIGWESLGGYECINRSADYGWLRGWHTERANMFAKIDARFDWNPTVDFHKIAWCNNCSELDWSQAIAPVQYHPNPLGIPSDRPAFHTLIWYFSDLTNKTDPALLQVQDPWHSPGYYDCSDGVGVNQDLNPELCWNCW